MKFWAGVSSTVVLEKIEKMSRDLKRPHPTDSKKIVPDNDKVDIKSDLKTSLNFFSKHDFANDILLNFSNPYRAALKSGRIHAYFVQTLF